MPRSRVALCLLAYLALRLWLATTPGYPPDVGQFKLWALQSQQDGLASLYAGGADHDFSRYDYPPLYAYVLRTIGWIYSWFEPDALRRAADSTLLTVLVKLPALLADLAIALLLAWIVRATARAPSARRVALPIVAAWLLNPAVLLDSGHWGQPDSIHSGFVLAAFACVGGVLGPSRGSFASIVGGWCLLALATLMKPLGAPFFPLLLAASLLVGGLRRTLAGGLAALATAALLFAPFVATFGVREVAERILGDVTIMSFTSVNAHNVWWLVGPWQPSERPWLGTVTATEVGLALFLCALAALIVLLVRRHRARRAGIHGAQLLCIAALLAAAFFLLSTHMHENHLFAALPLLLGALAAAPPGNGARRSVRWIAALLAFGIAWNLAAHDFVWRHRWPFSIGPIEGELPAGSDGAMHGGERLAGTLGAWWNLLAGVALTAFVFGAGLMRLAWSSARPGVEANDSADFAD